MANNTALRSHQLRRMRANANGIEGLPLRLLIIVIITVVALSIIMLWLGSIGGVKELKAPVSDPEDISITGFSQDQQANRTLNIKITVYDNKNNKVGGVIVTLDGCNVFTSGKTDSDGTVTFDNVDVSLNRFTATGIIKVTAQKSGYKTGDTEIYVYRT